MSSISDQGTDYTTQIHLPQDTSEMEVFDALLLLGRKCRIHFATDEIDEVQGKEQEDEHSCTNHTDNHVDNSSADDNHDDDEDEYREGTSEESDDDHFHDDLHPASESNDECPGLVSHQSDLHNHCQSLTGKRKIKRFKRTKRKRRRSLDWERNEVATSCKEAMRRVRNYLHTQRHTHIPSYIIPVSDMHSFFGLMYFNIMNVGDSHLVLKFFELFATPRILLSNYYQASDPETGSNTKKFISKMRGGDLIALYFALFFESCPDVVVKLRECHIIPATDTSKSDAQASAHREEDSHLHSTTSTSHDAHHNSRNDTSGTVNPTFSPHEYICCCELVADLEATRVWDIETHQFLHCIHRDSALCPPQQRAYWSCETIAAFTSSQPRKELSSYTTLSFLLTIKLYINARRKVDRIEIVRSMDLGWL